MGKFRKIPVTVTAIQFFEDKYFDFEDVVTRIMDSEGNYHYYVETLEGRMELWDRWWIITGVEGEHYPCKPSIFEKTYEPVYEEDDKLDNLSNNPHQENEMELNNIEGTKVIPCPSNCQVNISI